ncbi:putative ester cyclase [Paraburkholderia sp. GAS333]|uniref:ester cyclase n=1 Tax=Paraburkholderia sp. GAS333 TaxID=3156279 RepID=UPI003D252F41
MDSSKLKEVVTRFNREVIEEGNRKSFDALMSTDFVNWSAPDATLRGAEAMWKTFDTVLRPALAGIQVQILDQLCDGDKVTTRKTVSGRHAGPLFGIEPTGRMISIDVIDIVRVRDGQYVEHWGVNTLAAVITQLQMG